tara:strand:- start:240 stop:779 length:540 start_codon:yes stop_codon:yes gene_type:complete
MEWGQQMQKHPQNIQNTTYHNPNYTFERINSNTLIIEMDDDQNGNTDILSSSKQFNVNLIEPLTIDKLSDIYLTSFITSNCKQSNKALMAFVLDIDQFNINSISNDSSTHNKITIPNMETSTPSEQIILHTQNSDKKYICSINPCKLTNISGSIKSPSAAAMFADGGKFIAEFEIISRN